MKQSLTKRKDKTLTSQNKTKYEHNVKYIKTNTNRKLYEITKKTKDI